MSEPDADQKAEMPEQPPRVGDGIAESRDACVKRTRHVMSTLKTKSL